MKMRNPLLGLLTFTFHDVGRNILYILPLPLLLGIAAQILRIDALLVFFQLFAIGSAPYIVMMKVVAMKSVGTLTWDRYQIAMPIKRKNVASIHYLSVLIASLLGIPIIGIIWMVLYVLFGSTLVETLNGGLSTMAAIYSMLLISASVLYPLILSQLGQRNAQGVFLGSVIIGAAVGSGMFGAGNAMGLTDTTLSLIIAGVSGIAFVVSLFITRAKYAKMDF